MLLSLQKKSYQEAYKSEPSKESQELPFYNVLAKASSSDLNFIFNRWIFSEITLTYYIVEPDRRIT
jgi:hypothetical protein